jgi:hypothetical protein
MTKASGGRTGTKGVPPPQSPAKAASPATKYSPSPEKEKEGKKADIKKIVIVSNPDATPFAKKFLKSLSNRNGKTTPPSSEGKYTGHSPI